MRFQVLFGLVSKSFVAPILWSKFGSLGLLKPNRRLLRYCKHQLFTDVVFMISESIIECFPKALGAVFLIFAALETGLNGS